MTVFAREVIDGQPVLAMQWIDGVPITDWATALSDTQGADRVLSTFLKVVDAAHHAHQRGLIHRDLKPSNILVDAAGEPHVLDFGLAKIIDPQEGDPDDVSLSGSVVGTPAYAAPEQLSAEPGLADIRVDVYALGVVLYRMLSGHLPYAIRRSIPDALRLVSQGPPAAPSQHAAGIDRDLDAIVLKAMAAEPSDRYQSMEALGADIRRFMCGQPVTAHPPSRLYAFKKFVARHRVAVIASGVMVLTIVGFAVTALLLARSANRARAEEHQARIVAERINSFLGEILSAARPSRGGASMKLLEMLDEASDRARTELVDQPHVAAEVLYQIGFTYRALWRYPTALPHLEESLKLFREMHTGDHEDVAKCLAVLGAVQTSRRKPEAVDLQREALDMRRRLYVGDHALVAESMTKLGYALHQAADPPQWEQAEQHFDLALAMYRRVFGAAHREIGSCLHNYGWLRVRQGRIADAAALYEQALQVFRDLGDLEDPFYAECMYGYVAQLMKLQRYEEALTWLAEAIPLIRRIYGEHDGLKSLLWQRAAAQQALGRFDDARIAYIDAFAVLCAEQARTVADATQALFDLKLRLDVAAQDQPARVPLDAVLAVLPLLPPREHGRLAAGVHRVAGMLLAEGNDSTAYDVMRRLLQLRDDHEAPGGKLVASTIEALADHARDQGDQSECERRLRACVDMLVETLPWQGWEQARVRSKLGACLVRQRRYAEAEKLLLENHPILADGLGHDHEHTQAAVRFIIDMYEAWGKPEQAKAWQ